MTVSMAAKARPDLEELAERWKLPLGATLWAAVRMALDQDPERRRFMAEHGIYS